MDERVFLKGCTAAKVPFLTTFWMDFAADLVDWMTLEATECNNGEWDVVDAIWGIFENSESKSEKDHSFLYKKYACWMPHKAPPIASFSQYRHNSSHMLDCREVVDHMLPDICRLSWECIWWTWQQTSEAAMVSMGYVHCKFEMRKGAEGMLGTVGVRGHHGGHIVGGQRGVKAQRHRAYTESKPKLEDTGLSTSVRQSNISLKMINKDNVCNKHKQCGDTRDNQHQPATSQCRVWYCCRCQKLTPYPYPWYPQGIYHGFTHTCVTP